MKFATQASEERWSSDELGRQILGEVGNRRPGSGRSLAAPKNLTAGLTQCETHSKKYLQRLDKALFGESFDLVSEIQNTPPDKLTPAIREQAASGVELLTAIANQALDNANRLRAAVQRIDAVLARQAQEVNVEEGDPKK